MISKRTWKSYPSTYRAREMQILADLIRAGESASIIGLPGAGKSNLLGYLSNRPEVLPKYLPDEFGPLTLIQVDLNNLPNNDLATFFRVILRSLFEAKAQLAAIDDTLATTAETLYRKVEDKTDPFLAQSALREVLLLFKEKQVRVVLVLDPFDQFCQVASTLILDNLRGLRDSFKANLSYLMGLRHEVTYIRNPVELGELYEIVDIHQCWLGAMEREDARWVISQVETATGKSFSDEHANKLIELTGGYPALLRAASLWLVQASPVPEIDAWQSLLMAEPSIKNRLEDLRHGLTGEEEAALSIIQKVWETESGKTRRESLRQIADKYASVLNRLNLKRLCQKTDEGWKLFADLFAEFVSGMQGVSAGKIRHDADVERFYLGDQELTKLSERDRRLLQHFLNQPSVAHTIDDLIEAAWPEDEGEGVSNEAVQQAIRHLRKQIEPNPAKPCYLVTERGAGYRFFAEGAPRGQ